MLIYTDDGSAALAMCVRHRLHHMYNIYNAAGVGVYIPTACCHRSTFTTCVGDGVTMAYLVVVQTSSDSGAEPNTVALANLAVSSFAQLR